MPRRTTTELTEKQEEALRVLITYIDEHDFPPTYQELASLLNLKYSSLFNRMESLIQKGYVERSGNARSVRVLRRLDDKPRKGRLVAIPLVGTVVAGMPVLAEENREGEILVELDVSDPENCFALKADGSSMIDVGIKTGDIVIVHKQRMASDGEIVIALVNGESTVKKLRYDKLGVELVPANKKMKPIKINELDDFRIQGVVLTWRSIKQK
jgi:repressor LexA